MSEADGPTSASSTTPDPKPVGVWLLCFALTGLLLLASLVEPRSDAHLAGPTAWCMALAIAVMFGAGELWPAEIELRRQSHSFVFTSVPLVVGLVLLPIPLVRLARVGASLLVLGLVRPHPAIKLTVNLAAHALEVTAAGLMLAVVGVPQGLGPRSWLAAVVAVVVAEIASSFVITLAISLYQRSWEPSVLAAMGVPLPFASIDIALALIVAGDIRQAAYWDLFLVVPVGIYVVLLTHRNARLSARHRMVQRLDQFARDLGAAVVEDDGTSHLLRQVADVMHAEHAWMWRPAADGPSKVVLRAVDGSIQRVEASRFDRSVLDDVRRGRRLFVVDSPDEMESDLPGPTEALVGWVQVGKDGSAILGVGERSGSTRGFDRGDVVLFETICSHVGVALRNVALVEQLRSESSNNEFLATHDSLTGLANRTLLQRHAAALTTRDPFTLLLLDLDRFKEVNDTLGHIRGDEVLVEVSRRLEPLIGAGELLSRLGGDEFVACLHGCTETEAVDWAWRALAEIRRPYSIGGVEIDLDASVGVTFSSDLDAGGGTDVAGLLRQADVAMYIAKENRSGVALYSPDVDSYDSRRLAMASRLRRAISNGDLILHYQPQVDLESGRVVGVEALARWHDAERGDVPPSEFIEVAERTDVIHGLTRFVLRKAIEQVAAWKAQGHDMRVAVNVSARNLGENDLVEGVADLLREYGVAPSNLEIELTETAVMANPKRAAEIMDELRSLGARVAIDDFGTGHSSLAYLTALAVDELKIDRSFVHAMATDRTAGTVVRAIVDLARSLELDVVAEGVETTKSVAALQSMRCTIAQGYFYARPMPADRLTAWLEQRKHATDAVAADL